jgi:hypothetical protein
MPANPQVDYNASRYRLANLKVREEPVTVHAYVPDKRDPAVTWLVAAVTTRLAMFQTLVQEFTDPDSFPLPPTIKMPKDTQAAAAAISKVSQASLLAGRYAKYAAAGMGPWEIHGQRVVAKDGVIYTLTTNLVARSNMIWNVDDFRRVKLPRSA